jgi:hypothetical protein
MNFLGATFSSSPHAAAFSRSAIAFGVRSRGAFGPGEADFFFSLGPPPDGSRLAEPSAAPLQTPSIVRAKAGQVPF